MNRWKKVCIYKEDASELTLSLSSPAYRFQLAGYKDELEYLDLNKGITVSLLGHVVYPFSKSSSFIQVDRWLHNNYVKKLRRKDGCFYYYNKTRECPDKDLNKVKIYGY